MDNSKECECGCGTKVSNGRTYVYGHNLKKYGGWYYWGKLKTSHPDEFNRRILKRNESSNITNKKNKTGLFDPTVPLLGRKAMKEQGVGIYDPKVGELGRKIMKERKVGVGFDPNLRLKAHEKMKREKRGFYDPKLQSELAKRGSKKGVETLRRLGKGVFDPKVRSKGLATQRANPEKLKRDRTRASKEAIKSRRESYPYWFMNVPFDSEEEKQAMMILCEKFDIVPKEGVNTHVRVDGGEIDFRLGDLFIEYHPWDRKWTPEQYYKRRRKLLDSNGFQDCRLIVAKSLEEVEEVL